MNPLPPGATDAGAYRSRRLIVLLVLLGAYVCLNVLGRWLRYNLWSAPDVYGWRQPTLWEMSYHLYMTCLPILFWGLIIYLAASWWPRILNPGVIALLTWVCLVFLDMDMMWYQMSRRHIAWADVETIFALDWGQDVGFRPADYFRFAIMVTVHAVVCALVWKFSGRLARTRLFGALARVHFKPLATTVACLVVLDCAALCLWGSAVEGEDGFSQWRELAEANPIRLRALDDLANAVADRFSEGEADLQQARAALAALPAPPPRAADRLPAETLPVAVPASCNVVVIGVESFSARMAAETKMPALQAFARRCLRLTNHYSTGNCTHYGILGMLCGAPVAFYHGRLATPMQQSPYLEQFAAHGYRTRAISTPLMGHYSLGEYVPNLCTDPFVGPDDWTLIPAFRQEVGRAGPHFTFLFYGKTHYPYFHRPSYHSHAPEVPEDFDYNAWDLFDSRKEIVNRYKNCLAEFDDWLRQVLDAIDLKRTIVVLTGDHGEEFFETGRLAHGSSLNTAQTHTPCLIYVPGLDGDTISTLTSHADLMPSVADLLGWPLSTDGTAGRSIFRKGAHLAIIAQQNYRCRPTRWAILTDDSKAIVEAESATDLRLTFLLNRAGKRLWYRDNPARWTANFQAIKGLQAHLP